MLSLDRDEHDEVVRAVSLRNFQFGHPVAEKTESSRAVRLVSKPRLPVRQKLHQREVGRDTHQAVQ